MPMPEDDTLVQPPLDATSFEASGITQPEEPVDRTPVLDPVQTVNYAEQEQAAFAQAAAQAFAGVKSVQTLNIGYVLLAEFAEAETLRRDTELRWLKDLRQYRGIYEPEELALMQDRSQAFVRRTRVKVKTTDSRVMDLLFPAGSEKNWTCDSTPVPSVDDETKAGVLKQLTQKLGHEPNDNELDQALVAMATEAAKQMTKVIEDQLVESRFKQVSGKCVHSGHLYGTGVVKGPLLERKVRTRFAREKVESKRAPGTQVWAWVSKDEEYVVPFVDFVPLWRFYPDMAATELDQCRYIYERHTMTQQEMMELARRKSFQGDVIRRHIIGNPRGDVRQRTFDQDLQELGDRESTQTKESNRYEVLERWGWLSGRQLSDAGVSVPPERMEEMFFSNVWLLSNGEVIKSALQPINGVTWPYHLYYFDKDETSIFGEGLSSIMRDDQSMLNAAIRMMLDNGALTSGPILEVCLDLLATTEDATKITPWKVFLRKKGDKDAGPAVRAVELPNNIEWLQKMASQFEQNTDEVTAIPRYMTGENTSQGAAGTASGMSMLMGAANIVIKDLINSWDEGITRPFIQNLYRWNMQFHKDDKIKGDFDMKARGTASLIAKEVRAQRLNEFALMADNPADAPFIKRLRLLQYRAEALEMSDVIKTEDEISAEQSTEQAKKMAEMQERLAAAQLQLAEGQAAKVMAEAEATKKKIDEMLANIELTYSKMTSTKVETIFAALQAGGVATRDPVIAPAGDEILKSAGYKDVTPNPSIASLATTPVQGQEQTQVLLNKGQHFEADPRVQEAMPDPTTPTGPGPAPGAVRLPDANTGQRAGIETPEVEAA